LKCAIPGQQQDWFLKCLQGGRTPSLAACEVVILCSSLQRSGITVKVQGFKRTHQSTMSIAGVRATLLRPHSVRVLHSPPRTASTVVAARAELPQVVVLEPQLRGRLEAACGARACFVHPSHDTLARATLVVGSPATALITLLRRVSTVLRGVLTVLRRVLTFLRWAALRRSWRWRTAA
jgi:hypothetical protein